MRRSPWMAVPLVAAALLVTGGAALAASGGAPRLGRGPLSSTFWAAVAAKVGVPATTLESAARSVLQQERASGQLPGPRGWRGGGGLGRAAGMRPLLTTAAGYLGISTTQFMTYLRNGQSLAQIATAAGKSVSGLEAALNAQAASEIQKLVQTPLRPPQGPGGTGASTSG